MESAATTVSDYMTRVVAASSHLDQEEKTFLRQCAQTLTTNVSIIRGPDWPESYDMEARKIGLSSTRDAFRILIRRADLSRSADTNVMKAFGDVEALIKKEERIMDGLTATSDEPDDETSE
jgi:hypothetical protein